MEILVDNTSEWQSFHARCPCGWESADCLTRYEAEHQAKLHVDRSHDDED